MIDFESDEQGTVPHGLDSKRVCIVKTAFDELGAGDWQKYTDGRTADHPGSRVAWCGIFALWVLHQCGVGTELQWQYGRGFLYQLPRTTSPKPGDMAYFDQPFQHHAIVVKVKGETLYTVDGNQAGDVVAERVRPIQDATAFFSIEPLLKGDIAAV